MELFAAIDVRQGRCVRLAQGDYDRQTVYDGDPVEVARRFEKAGAHWIHVVDLDAARTGRATNRGVVEAVAAAVSVPVQTGGGVRTMADAEALLGAGVTRVVIGTAAVEDPGLVSSLAAAHPGRVAVGLDHRLAGGRRMVAVRGWESTSSLELAEATGRLADAGAAAAIVTDIGRDGMLGGPDVDGLAGLLAESRLPIVASGGVSSVADVAALAAVEADGRRLAGVVVGRALYEGRLSVEEAVAACSR
ncbi:MAG TPA: 1-(5-phosphoribosyl)-5-[(5-phosphoribosylamino)methylideneamino]imidazole-4-carboxamide isomerase [Acidimicrobiales bacterium]|nr:1-(5-phosphoribosyl)-5-[(5-phosphoribosylamino)methylideneamino]imidazole-4-carboxamide isomerase [Acidimicrobiales bacterium]